MVAELDRGLPVRGFLSSLFISAKTPFVIGPGIDGTVSLSTESQKLSLEKTVQLVVSTLPYKAEYTIEDGIHIIRRHPDQPTTTAAPTVNVAQPAISIAPAKISLTPMTMTNYRDALLWELTRTEIERQRMAVSQTNIDINIIAAADRVILLLKKRLAELDGKRPLPVRTAAKR
jgi:hypothetical protein